MELNSAEELKKLNKRDGKENKKMREILRTKHYNKQIYKAEENLKTCAIIIILFCIGFMSGYFIAKNQVEKEEAISNEIQIHNTL